MLEARRLYRVSEVGGIAELRIYDTLWPLHDAVVTSTFDFSVIRMRNAFPRSQD